MFRFFRRQAQRCLRSLFFRCVLSRALARPPRSTKSRTISQINVYNFVCRPLSFCVHSFSCVTLSVARMRHVGSGVAVMHQTHDPRPIVQIASAVRSLLAAHIFLALVERDCFSSWICFRSFVMTETSFVLSSCFSPRSRVHVERVHAEMKATVPATNASDAIKEMRAARAEERGTARRTRTAGGGGGGRR